MHTGDVVGEQACVALVAESDLLEQRVPESLYLGSGIEGGVQMDISHWSNRLPTPWEGEQPKEDQSGALGDTVSMK